MIHNKKGLVDTAYGEVQYSVEGKGSPVVFLHGFLESMKIWTDFIPLFHPKYQTICIDFPGHGQSSINFNMLTTEDMANTIAHVLANLRVDNAVLVGHSMGGYAALAFAELFPQICSGLILLHSHPNADSHEKVASRINDIEKIEMGLKQSFVELIIPRLYSNENVKLFDSRIIESKRIAIGTPDLGIIAALRGMAARKDRNHVIASLPSPVLMIFGKKDNLISNDTAINLEKKHSQHHTAWLEKSGHMGFIEEPDQTANAILSFLTELFERD